MELKIQVALQAYPPHSDLGKAPKELLLGEEPGLSPPPPRVSVLPLSLGFSRTGDQCQRIQWLRNFGPQDGGSDGHVYSFLLTPLVDQGQQELVSCLYPGKAHGAAVSGRCTKVDGCAQGKQLAASSRNQGGRYAGRGEIGTGRSGVGSLPTHSRGREVPWWSLCSEASAQQQRQGESRLVPITAPAGAQ